MKFIASPNYSKGRPYGIDAIMPHHMAGKLTAEQCGNIFANPNRQASAHLGIGFDGEIAQYVDYGNRAWAAGDGINRNSRGNDRAIHIEVSNDANDGRYRVSDASFETLVNACYEIAKEYNLLPLVPGKNLIAHREVSSTYCPGDYLYGKFGELADRVNAKAGGETPEPTPEPEKPSTDGLPARGWIQRGDDLPIVDRISKFMRNNFPAYTDKRALGSYYGPYIESSIKEFQRRTKAEGKYNDVVDGCVGPKTLATLKAYGFQG